MIETEANKLDGLVLKVEDNSYYTKMSELDQYGFTPEEDSEGRFYFVINIKGEDVKFLQSAEYPNVFDDEHTTQAWIFAPDKGFDGVELHIINDYE